MLTRYFQGCSNLDPCGLNKPKAIISFLLHGVWSPTSGKHAVVAGFSTLHLVFIFSISLEMARANKGIGGDCDMRHEHSEDLLPVLVLHS